MVNSPSHIRLAHQVLLVLLLSLGFSTHAWARDVQARIHKQQIDANELLTFTVEAEGDVRSILPPENSEFEIVSRSTQTSMSFVNGQMTRRLSATYQLAPKQHGTFTVGPARVVLNTGGIVESETFEVVVTGTRRQATPQTSQQAAPQRSGSMPPIPGPSASRNLRTPAPKEFGDFPPLAAPGSEALITTKDHRFDPSKPFILPFVSKEDVVVGEPFLVEYMYFAPFSRLGFQATDLSEPAFKDAWFKDIYDARQNAMPSVGTVQIGGQFFSSQIVRSYLIVPLKEGSFEVAPISLMIEERSFSRRMDPELTTSPPITVNVQPVPEDERPSAQAHSVGRYHFEATLSAEEGQVGDTFQLHLEVFGIGVPSQIRIPEVQLPDGLRAFAPSESSRSTESVTGWVESRVQRTLSFQASKEGDYSIPPIEFHWYDPWDQEWKTQRSDAIPFRVQGVNPNIEIEAPQEAESKPLRVSWLQGLPTGINTPAEIGFAARLRKPPEPWTGNTLYFLLLSIPILATLTISLGSFVRRRRHASKDQRDFDRAGSSHLRELRQTKFQGPQSFSQLERITRTYLRARYVPGAVGATFEELRGALIESRDEARANTLIDLLEQLQEARFGGHNNEDFKTLKAALMAWIREDQEELVS